MSPTRRSLSLTCLLVLAMLAAACGSRLPDEVLAQIDDAALAGDRGDTRTRATSDQDGAVVEGDDDTASGPGTDSAGVTTAPGDVGAAEQGGGQRGPTESAGDENCQGGATDTGVTADEIKVASIVTASGPLPGATEGGYRGAAAYLAKINAEGGVCGRQITLLKGDDGLDPQRARGEFLRLEPEVLGFVGSFAVADSGYIDLIESTGVPYVGTSVDPAGGELPNVVPRSDRNVGHTGPYEYYKREHPDVNNVGFMFADVGGVRSNVPGVVKGFETAGFDVVYNSGSSATQVDFTPDVINLREKTELLYLFAFEVNMHVRIARNMRQQNWEPKVKVSNIGYNSRLVDLLGPIANGWSNHLTYLPMLNADEPARSPALAEFLTWHDRLFPGQSIDLFPVTAWGDAARFVEALRQVGADVTREKIIEAVDTLAESDGGGMTATIYPAERRSSGCFIIVRVENERWVREHPSSGYECDMGERYRF